MKRLFGADGIRGVVDQHPMTIEAAERLGRALAAWIRSNASASRPACLVAMDTRESCVRFRNALVSGLRQGGVRIIDAGVLPTAGVSHLVVDKGSFAAGVMISASHSPVEENGIKVFDSHGCKVSDDTEDLIERWFFGEQRLPYESLPASYSEAPNYAYDYAHTLAKEFQDFDGSRVQLVLDCANGAISRIAPQVCTELQIAHHLLNANPNGANINYRAGSEFVRANPRGFALEAERHHADLAIAFDGDADRVVLVDRMGRFFDGDTILATLAATLHDRRELRAGTVVITPMSNTGLHHYLTKRSLKTQLVCNGDKYITEALLANQLTLGGEEIGHIIIHNQRTRLTGDGLRTMLTLLSEWMRCAPRAALWELAGSFKKFPQIKAAVYTGRVGRPAPQDIPGLPELLAQVSEQVQDFVRPIVCRPASTEPFYRLMLEAYFTPVHVLACQAQRLAEHIQHALDCRGKPVTILDNVNGGIIDLPR